MESFFCEVFTIFVMMLIIESTSASVSVFLDRMFRMFFAFPEKSEPAAEDVKTKGGKKIELTAHN